MRAILKRQLKIAHLRCLRPDSDADIIDGELCSRVARTGLTWDDWYNEAYMCAAIGFPFPWEPGYVPSKLAQVVANYDNTE